MTIRGAQPSNAGRYTVMVADSMTFTVTVPVPLEVTPFVAPSVSQPAWLEGRFSVTVVTKNGLTYVLESKDPLTEPVWLEVSRNL